MVLLGHRGASCCSLARLGAHGGPALTWRTRGDLAHPRWPPRRARGPRSSRPASHQRRATGRRAARPSRRSSVLRPASCRRRRARPSRSASSPSPGPHWPASRARSHEARAGLGPPVDTATVTVTVAMHRRQDERAVRAVVGAVHPHAGRLGIGVDRAVDRRDAGRGHHQAVAGRARPRRSGRRSEVSGVSCAMASQTLGGDHRHRGAAVARARAPCGRPRDRRRPPGRAAPSTSSETG